MRQYSDKSICPPNPPPKSDHGGSGGKFFLTLGAIALAGGATLGYAKYDSDFRKSLTTYVPYTETILETMDNNSISSLYNSAKKSILTVFVGEEKAVATKKDIIPEPKEYKGRFIG